MSNFCFLPQYARSSQSTVNTTRDLGSFNCPIRFENGLAISRDCKGAVQRARNSYSLLSLKFANFFQNRQKLCWLLSAGMTCLFHLLKVRIALKIRISINLVLPTMMHFVIVHAGSGKSRCLPFVYLFSILRRENISVKVNSLFKHC